MARYWPLYIDMLHYEDQGLPHVLLQNLSML